MCRWITALTVFLFLPYLARAATKLPSYEYDTDSHLMGILLEPELGYTTGGWKYSWGDSSFSGYSYGARVGVDIIGVQFGIEYMGGHWNDDQAPPNAIAMNDVGAFFGYRFPAYARVYATYFFSAQSTAKSSEYNNAYSGYEAKIGVGVTVYDPITLNLEYTFGSFNQDNGGGFDYELRSHYVGFMISVPWIIWFGPQWSPNAAPTRK